ncbi:MAG: hypothetical protein LRZ85_08035 [Alphaproteobacteria bacterium]|nr:hypothetical protein [Alphaproteobacteria bacterium]MCD8570764.1 hypothetical protein [Alphaproteobacteria bacterium]
MKTTGMILLALVMVAGLSACKTTVHDGPRKVIVQDGGHGDGDFCPPGQAKKGNC